MRLFTQMANNFTRVLNDMSGENPIDGTIVRYNCKKSYLKKVHVCFECNESLEIKRREVVVNSRSEEAKNYDFYVFDGYAEGNIRFITYYFECPGCDKAYEIRDYINLEKTRKKEQRKRRT